MLRTALTWCGLSAMILVALPLPAQEGDRPTIPYAPDRRADEGEGPFQRLIIRGVTVIDGTGAPPIGPMDVVVEGNRIVEVVSVGAPKVPIDPERRPKGATKELDAQGMYLMPGFVDSHAHSGGRAQGTPAEYVFKLWLAHGVTTIRDPGSGNGVDWTIHERERSRANAIVAPRIFVYLGAGWVGGQPQSAEQAREFVRTAAAKGVDGFKLGAFDPEIMEALIDEASKHGLGTQAHLYQMGTPRMTVLDAARLGLGTQEHFWYGLPEALFEDRTVHDYPVDYNYQDEQDRFRDAVRVWKLAAKPGSAKRNAVIEELLEHRFIISPTFQIIEATTDVMRGRTLEWHEAYSLPSLMKFWTASRVSHGSFYFDWTTQDEIESQNNTRLAMEFMNEYKNRGGRVIPGSDAGYVYSLYGFAYIRELELLQTAGFHPLEVIRAATMHAAQALHEPKGKPLEFGIIRPGMLADMVLVEENPLQNLKVLYGTGALRLNDGSGRPERVGGIKYTIKDGIIYDAKQLLADVARIVSEAQEAAASGGSSGS